MVPPDQKREGRLVTGTQGVDQTTLVAEISRWVPTGGRLNHVAPHH
jgi:hypothetical protein